EHRQPGRKAKLGVHLALNPKYLRESADVEDDVADLVRAGTVEPVVITDSAGMGWAGRREDISSADRAERLSARRVRFDVMRLWGFATEIGGPDLVVTIVLHAGITAMALGVPTISLPMLPETIRLYRQIGRAELCVPFVHYKKGTMAVLYST